MEKSKRQRKRLPFGAWFEREFRQSPVVIGLSLVLSGAMGALTLQEAWSRNDAQPTSCQLIAELTRTAPRFHT